MDESPDEFLLPSPVQAGLYIATTLGDRGVVLRGSVPFAWLVKTGRFFERPSVFRLEIDVVETLDDAFDAATGRALARASDVESSAVAILVSAQGYSLQVAGPIKEMGLDQDLLALSCRAIVEAVRRTELPAHGLPAAIQFENSEDGIRISFIGATDEVELGPILTTQTLPGLSPVLDLYLDPGDATEEQIAAFYSALSELHRAFGGAGLELVPGEVDVFEVEVA